mgnify:CR=1 FL=1
MPGALHSRITLWLDLIRWDRPAGWLLLLWPSLSALWIAAGGWPGWHLLVVFVLGTILMRSAGCCVNDVADRDFDKHVKRTAQRPVTTGQVSVKEALGLGAVLALVSFGLVLTTNMAAVLWSVPAVLVAIAYPFTKRIIAMPQAVLGIAFNFGIVIAFAAVQGSVPAVALRVAKGFCVGLAATGLGLPRGVLPLADGRVLVTDLGRWDAATGRLLILIPKPGSYESRPILKGLDRPHGLQTGPDGQVYLAEAGRILRVNLERSPPTATPVITGLPNGGRHPLKQFVFGPDGAIYVNVGASTDHCEDAPSPRGMHCPEAEREAQDKPCAARAAVERAKAGPAGDGPARHRACRTESQVRAVAEALGGLAEGTCRS